LSVYLDASALLPTILAEPASAAVDRYIGAATSALLVSEFAAAEVGAAISRLVRMRLLDEARARRRLADFDAWRAADTTLVDVEASDVRLAGVIVRRFELMLRAPDALHLAICQRLKASLMTLDLRLAAAAGNLGVEAIAL
jgi:uncharacterized protein